MERKGYDENGNIIYKLINGNGKVQEYKGNQLKFEGEYLNGLKNGKGKEFFEKGEFHIHFKDNNNDIYITEKLILEGEYINGLLNGIGKCYRENGTLALEIKFLNGQNFGKIKIYDKNGNLKSEV